MRKLIAAISVTLFLAGCGTTGGFGTFTKALTTTINNPIGDVDIYRVKNTYAAALELAVEYRRYCWSATYAVLMTDPVARPVCSGRRGVVRAIQSANQKAYAAIAAADKFVAQNPTISATSAINAAWQAVTDFQNAIPAKKG